MAKAIFRFYEELNDFLPKQRKKTSFTIDFTEKRSIKDVIEALGVPHTEVDLLLVNGKSVDFAYLLQNGDRVSVYPVFETFNITKVTRLRKFPLRKTHFIVDVNLGALAKYMRALGFDVYFNPSLTALQIIAISRKENRIILTPSRKLLKFREVTHGIYVRKEPTIDRIKRILDLLDIKDQVKPFSRCLCCNGQLQRIAKGIIAQRIPPKTKEFCDEYSICEACDRIYWPGTHYLKMKKVIDKILAN